MKFDIADGWAVAQGAPVSNGAGGFVNGRQSGVISPWLIAAAVVAVLLLRRKNGKA